MPASAREGLPTKAKDYLTRAENKLLRELGTALSVREPPRYLTAPGVTREDIARIRKSIYTPYKPLYLPAPGMTKEETMRMRAQTAHSSALKAGADTDAAESAARLAGMLNKDIRFYRRRE